MEILMSLDTPPTAVFASSDVQAFGAWSFARDRGLTIPRDVALIGYDNLKLSRYLDLSSVDQQMQEVGRRATVRLLSRMESPTDDRIQDEIPVTVVVRGSSQGRTRNR